MDAVCVGKQNRKPSLPGTSISAPRKDCQCSRVTTKLFNFKPDVIPSVVYTHKSCVCNEVVALNHRHQIDSGLRFTSKLSLFATVKDKVKYIEPVSESVILHRATPRKRKLLEQASTSLKASPLNNKDGKVRMFLKDDKYHVMKVGAPRCIQYRSKRYCLPLACYLHPIEKYMLSWDDMSGSVVFAKGRNLIERGKDIETKFNFFVRPTVTSLDHSKFDAHVNKDLLRFEHRFYRACNNDGEFKFLLSMQELNKGTTRNGTKYRTPYTRMSGDQNTGCGNSLINYAMTKAILDKLKIKYCLYIDGDDFLVFTETEDSFKITPNLYQQFGMETKLDKRATTMEDIEFCQTKPVFNGMSYTMVRNPIRMLERLQWGVGKFNQRYVVNYLTSVGYCCLSLGMGLPVEQYVGEKLTKLGGRIVNTNLTMVANQMFVRPGKACVIEPALITRLSYERAFGVTLQMQQDIERLDIDLNSTIQSIALPQYASIKEEYAEGHNVPFWSQQA